MDILRETVEKSDHDKKSYRVIKLGNGLKALLISEPSSLKTGATGPRENFASCGLNISIGSFSDPKDIHGLAHFVNCVISKGSDKYPSENEFAHFLHKHGGFYYNDTNSDETKFTISILESSFDAILERFSQFVKKPTMSKDIMTAEREIINAKFISNQFDDDWRLEQFLSSLVQADFNYKISYWLSKPIPDKIDDDELYIRAHEFRKRHYSAHRMHLCLQARMTLDELQELAVKHFSDIPNNQLPPNDFSALTHENILVDKFYDKVFFVKSQLDNTVLNLFWSLPSSLRNYKSRPLDYLSALFHHESEGSLIHYLRKNFWIDRSFVDASCGQSSVLTMFRVHISLTELGFSNIDKVIEAIFSYVRFLKHVGPNERLFKEMQKIAATSFQYATEKDSYLNVEKLASKMREYPSEHIVSGGALYMEYDPKAIQQVIDHLNEKKFNITIMSGQLELYDNTIKFNLKDKYFGTEYCERDKPEKWIDMWNNVKPFEYFHLPEPNPYIADDFTIFYDKNVPKYPVKILENDVCELWHRQDDKFLLPHASLYLYFLSPIIKPSIKNTALLEFYLSVLRHHTSELYLASQAKYDYYFYKLKFGLVLWANGYNQKFHLVVDALVKLMKRMACDVTEQEFSVFLKERINYITSCSMYPVYLNYNLGEHLLRDDQKSLVEEMKALKLLRFEDFQQFCHEFLKEMQIKCLIQGNVTEASAKNIMDNVLTELNPEQIKDKRSIEINATKLPIGNTYLRCNGLNFSDINTIIVNYYQIGIATHRNKALTGLLMDIGRNPIQDLLRSKEQLGYDARFAQHGTAVTIGYLISINSLENKFSAEYVDERIENARQELISIIEKISDDEFDSFKLSLIQSKRVEVYDLDCEAYRNWKEITENSYVFDRLDREVEALKAVTKAEILEFYLKHLNEENRKLSVQILGNPNGGDATGVSESHRNIEDLSFVDFSTPKADAYLIRDIVQFKKELELYPSVENITN